MSAFALTTPAGITAAQQLAVDIYASLMEEVKIRVMAIEGALGGQMVRPAWMIREFCYLQLRMICELIALGCLVAHGDIKTTRTGKLPKEWNADKIFAILENLYARFYPTPLRHVSTKGNVHHLEPIKSGFLTKADLISLNHKSGRYLHRGTMKSLLSPEPIYEEFPDVVAWVNKIQALLSTHTLHLHDEAQFVCVMSNRDNGNRVGVNLGVPVGKPKSA